MPCSEAYRIGLGLAACFWLLPTISAYGDRGRGQSPRLRPTRSGESRSALLRLQQVHLGLQSGHALELDVERPLNRFDRSFEASLSAQWKVSGRSPVPVRRPTLESIS